MVKVIFCKYYFKDIFCGVSESRKYSWFSSSFAGCSLWILLISETVTVLVKLDTISACVVVIVLSRLQFYYQGICINVNTTWAFEVFKLIINTIFTRFQK